MMYKKHPESKMKGFSSSLCFLLILFCSFFSVNSLPVNPVYCLGFPLILFSFLFFKSTIDKFQLGFYCYFLISCMFFAIGSYYFSNIDSKINYLSTILYLYCILMGAQTVATGVNIGINRRVYIYKFIFNLLIIFMILEFFLRVVNSSHTGSFYDYKWSLLYFDSNFVSFIILFFLMFAVFLKEKNIFNIGKMRFSFLFVLLILTFSRASLVSFIVTYLFVKSGNKYKTPIFILFLIGYFYIASELIGKYTSGVSYVDVDGSFNSKFYLISVAIDNYNSIPVINKLFGIGLNNFLYYSDGIFAHNIFITLLYEFGVLGTIMFIFFLCYSYYKIGKDVAYIYIPLLVAGFSLFSAYVPFLFVLIACMYIETRYLKQRV
ncbi:putative membrane protein [Acinetobacter baumannii]|uniref:Putative membrane protein n=2 Tax=Acinetobacter baumannii TaxID=470 RepID=A0A7U7Q6J5_ACIBA|nr:putative membrane protein [Acinetobacter baumannii P630]CRL92818.1 putative membrane protein [Acinetobacter baumannii]CUW33502.1 putative membrane protein [Acinetobacter baumannii]